MMNLITQCRSSGLTDRQWCIEDGIPVSTFYYHVRALRKKACEVPEAVDAAAQKKDGFCLHYKRLDNGRFQWPRDSSEVRNLTRQEYRWLLEGLFIDQPKAIRPAGRKDF